MPLDNVDADFENEDFEEEWKPGKQIRFLVTAEIEIDENHIYEDNPVEDNLIDEFIKIKSGLYENLVSGWVTKVVRISDNAEETE